MFLNLGDEIEVNGQKFILVGFQEALDKPARVEFKQPMELLGKDSKEPKTWE